jgi:broad specificity phosphatase PhoE
VILVRHAHARGKAQWHQDDSLRPLTARGRTQAAGLIASLAMDDLSAAWSSPTVRCRQTLVPLAVDRGLDIQDHPMLAKGAPAKDLLEWMLAHASVPWVVCTHGEVLNALLLTAHSSGLVTAPAIVTEKGAAWRVTDHPDSRTELEYLPPPLPR